MIYWQLFIEFFKTGLFSVGGGMATLPFLYDMSDKFGWFTHQQLADMLAVSESTPGPIGVNMATYVGFGQGGVLGGIVATLGLVMPSVIVISLIARVLQQFRANPHVEAAFYGLRPASTALIASACLTMVSISLLNVAAFTQSGDVTTLFLGKEWALALVILVLTRWVKATKKLHPIVFVFGSALVGVAFGFGG